MITCARMNNLPMIIRRGLSCAYDFHDNDNSIDARDVWLFNLVIEASRTNEFMLMMADDIEFNRNNRADVAAKLREYSEIFHWVNRTVRHELKKQASEIYNDVD